MIYWNKSRCCGHSDILQRKRVKMQGLKYSLLPSFPVITRYVLFYKFTLYPYPYPMWNRLTIAVSYWGPKSHETSVVHVGMFYGRRKHEGHISAVKWWQKMGVFGLVLEGMTMAYVLQVHTSITGINGALCTVSTSIFEFRDPQTNLHSVLIRQMLEIFLYAWELRFPYYIVFGERCHYQDTRISR